MPVTAVVGAQWGDEGKGKIVDLLAADAHVVARFGGGSNAGHTVVNSFGTFRLHALPSGAFHRRALNIVGTGAVVDFASLSTELDQLRAAGVHDVRLLISDRAHVVMPYHKLIDRLSEEARGEHRLGTTGQGIGPSYMDKVERTGTQAGELLDLDRLQPKLERTIENKNRLLRAIYGHGGIDLRETLEQLSYWRETFGASIRNAAVAMAAALDRDDSILLEGQLGIMRDIDWGTYPYVTSSTTSASGAASGAAIPPGRIVDVVGVVKAYTSAVGEGPLPTELADSEGEELRRRGDEFGATTGRPRRVGWLDGVALKYSARLGAFTRLALTKLDVLTGVDPLRIATAYKLEGGLTHSMPHPSRLGDAEPVYEEMAGWNQPIEAVETWDDLPAAAREYAGRISELAGAPISYIGVGKDRQKTIRVPAEAGQHGASRLAQWSAPTRAN